MIAYQNRLITLTFLKEYDILIAAWTNSTPYDVLDIQKTNDKIIETIKAYQCRKLLSDASEAVMALDEATKRVVLTDFLINVGKAGIEKLARIISARQNREELVQAIRNEVSLPYQMYDISNREQALNWLKKS